MKTKGVKILYDFIMQDGAEVRESIGLSFHKRHPDVFAVGVADVEKHALFVNGKQANDFLTNTETYLDFFKNNAIGISLETVKIVRNDDIFFHKFTYPPIQAMKN